MRGGQRAGDKSDANVPATSGRAMQQESNIENFQGGGRMVAQQHQAHGERASRPPSILADPRAIRSAITPVWCSL
jgi:hypothetical protein